MEIAAVTGTDGKTSTVEFTRQLLTGAGRRVSTFGSLGLITPTGRDRSPVLAVGSSVLPTLSESQADLGADVFVIEAFSSALAGGAWSKMVVNSAAFTTFGHDHLDLHGDRPAYLAAKLRLFRENVAPGGMAVVADDLEDVAELEHMCVARALRVLRQGRREGSNLRLVSAAPCLDGIQVRLDMLGRPVEVHLQMLGAPLVRSVLSACGLAVELGVDRDHVVTLLAQLRPPPGRLEVIGSHRGARVVVDAGHTPQALESALRTLRARTTGRLHVVVGCGGERDKTKRHATGQVAGRLADMVVVTDDNSRNEDASAIRRMVLDGCPKAQEVPSRVAALTHALAQLRAGDMLLVAGRGDEDYLEVAGCQLPCSDRAELQARLDVVSSPPAPITALRSLPTESMTQA